LTFILYDEYTLAAFYINDKTVASNSLSKVHIFKIWDFSIFSDLLCHCLVNNRLDVAYVCVKYV